MLGCGMHSRPKLAEKARYDSILKNKQRTTKNETTEQKPTGHIHSGVDHLRSVFSRWCYLPCSVAALRHLMKSKIRQI